MAQNTHRHASRTGESHHPRKLTLQDRKRLFKAWQAHQSAPYVARTTGFARGTVHKYRKLDRWDERLKEIQAKAEALFILILRLCLY